MKKISLAVLAVMAPAAAFASSSVTLYGLVRWWVLLQKPENDFFR